MSRNLERQQVFNYVTVERQVGLAAEVGQVEADPATRYQHPQHFPHDSAEKGPVLGEGKVFVVVLADVVGRRGYHQVDAAIGQGIHPFGRRGKNGIGYAGWKGVFEIGDASL